MVELQREKFRDKNKMKVKKYQLLTKKKRKRRNT